MSGGGSFFCDGSQSYERVTVAMQNFPNLSTKNSIVLKCHVMSCHIHWGQFWFQSRAGEVGVSLLGGTGSI